MPGGNYIIPVFIPHHGCPHQCVFCNQKKISGAIEAPTTAEVETFLEAHLKPERKDAVIAFYGGSFTALPLSEQEDYLSAARRFVEADTASGIKLSTRPDCIDEPVISLLQKYKVKTVELGIQSLDNEVLRLSGRGHSASDSLAAVMLLKASGFEVGMQLMAGLPGDNEDKFLDTVRRTVYAEPAFVRIYPALVVDGSPMEQLWRRGEYCPISLDEAVRLCAEAVKLFRAAGIKVIRLGLQAGKDLEGGLLAGPYHPSFGHLVESAIALGRMRQALSDVPAGAAEVRVNPRELSVYKGIKSSNVEALARDGWDVLIKADEGVGEKKMALGCHSERSEESLFRNPGKEEILQASDTQAGTPQSSE